VQQLRHRAVPTGSSIAVSARLIFVCLLWNLPSAPALAIDPTEGLSELHHTQWLTRDGAPSSVNALAQTTDGYLWLACATGLFKFDGERFTQFRRPDDGELLTGDVSALLATPDGGLWIGMRFGGAHLLTHGELRDYGERDGLPSHSIFNFAIRDDGTVWAQLSTGLYHLEMERWLAAGKKWAYPDSGYALLAAKDGTLWARGAEGTFFLRHGEKAFQKSSVAGGVGWIVSGPGGQPWAADGVHGLLTLADPFFRVSKKDLGFEHWDGSALLFDRDGGLWTGRHPDVAAPFVLMRIPDLGTILRQKGGLIPDDFQTSSAIPEGPRAMFEDREGNIWMATAAGLHRFRSNKLHAAPQLGNITTDPVLTGDQKGNIWLANRKSIIMIPPWPAEPRTLPNSSSQEVPSALLVNRDGSLWVGQDRSGLHSYSNGKLLEFEKPDGRQARETQALMKDRVGALWMSALHDGLYRRDGTVWTLNGNIAGLPSRVPVTMLSDESGLLWFGYADNTIATVRDQHVRMLGEAEGLNVGPVLVINVQKDRVWVGGPNNAMLFLHDRFWTMKDEAGSALTGVSGIVQDEEGGLWLNGARGVTYIDPAEIQEFVKDPGRQVRMELLTYEDGLDGVASQLRPVPSAAYGGDGRVWFSTSAGVYWIDSKHIPRNRLPPPVQILSVLVNGKPYGASAGTLLPKHTTDMEIDYTALSLSIPSRVRFKYKLDGVDAAWKDAGSRRQAFYTNLSPGTHQFHVIAANEDGIWNESGATAGISIPPAFYQTRWFYTLCGIAVLGLLWLIYRFRLQQLGSQLRARMGVRLEERERIARELHDTLLQSTQGLILVFQGFAGRLEKPDAMRTDMETALDQADKLLNEVRDRVRDIRTTGLESDLPPALSGVGEEIFAGAGIEFKLIVTGSPRPLVPAVADDIYRIGREALLNAFAHARSTAVEAEIAYEPAELRLRIRDNGRGVTPEILKVGSRQGHFGLQGMRERAQRIGAQFNVWSAEGAGTEVELVVPARSAYRDSQPRWRWMLRPFDLRPRSDD
jgi:signal transduction histidine kinase/ligand-binding sensor domain-containing protein